MTASEETARREFLAAAEDLHVALHEFETKIAPKLFELLKEMVEFSTFLPR